MNKEGYLVVAGGNVGRSKEEIYGEFLRLAGGENAKICVVVVSSAIPLESFSCTQTTLVKLGAKPSNINCLPLSLIPNLISQGWSSDGDDPALLPYLKDLTGVWFVGGDQMKTVKALLRNYEKDTASLKLIREVYENGGVVGGTSAGASIMGKFMIGAGSDLASLTLPIETDAAKYEGSVNETDGQVLLTRGFNLFSSGLIDQHFNTRPRLTRLIASMDLFNISKSFGICEDTAFVYDREQNQIEVLGSAYVCFIKGNPRYKRITKHYKNEIIKL
ncbi:MAG: cyanophycinase [Clostridia bacterium]